MNNKNLAGYFSYFDLEILNTMDVPKGSLLHKFILEGNTKKILELIKHDKFDSYYSDWKSISFSFPQQQKLDVGYVLSELKKNSDQIKVLLK